MFNVNKYFPFLMTARFANKCKANTINVRNCKLSKFMALHIAVYGTLFDNVSLTLTEFYLEA